MAETPNIVFVFADQMRASALGCLGVEEVRTPNLDAFAGEGTLFSRAVANYPVCSPARATILTGLHALRHGLVVNDQQLRTDVTTIAHVLGRRGYGCGYVGKWHIDCLDRGVFIPPGPRRRGFDDLWAVNNCNHNYLNSHYYLDSDPEPVWIDGYEADAQTDIAVQYLRKKSASAVPFVLFLSWGPPHCPYRELPQSYLDMYPSERIRLKPNAWSQADKATIAGYYAHISALDRCFGRIVRALDECGATEDTIVVFTSDHGDMLYSQNKGWKMKPWAESIGIPLLARWPGKIPAGRRCDAPVGLVDLAPTLLALTGTSPPPGLDGADLGPLFLGDETHAPDSQLIHAVLTFRNWSVREWRGVVTRRHTYARFRDEGLILYDDTEDPHQLRNLIGDPNAAPVREELEGKLQGWLERTEDPFDDSEKVSERLVFDKIVVSEDKTDLAAYLQREFALAHPTLPDVDRIAAEVPFRPHPNRVLRWFDNVRIASGKRGQGRRRFHHELFGKG